MFRRNEGGMTESGGMAELEQLVSKGDDVVRKSGSLQCRIKSAQEPLVMGGDSSRAVARMTALSLNAADG